ncbi:MAG: Crp/Fnr family transcriptional regulator [Bacteroidota bacterium]
MDKTICQLCKSKSAATEMLNDNELSVLSENCAVTNFLPGDIIIKQDAHSTNVAFLKSGLVKIHVAGTVKDKILKLTKAPAYLCLPSNFGDKINHFSATALEPTTVCFIDVNVFKKFIYENSDFAFQIILEMSKNELQNFHNCLNNAQKQNIGRVADVILLFANTIYNSNTFILPVTREELAALAGITRESVSRILTEFNNDKTLKVNGRQITILNEKLLKQISEKG